MGEAKRRKQFDHTWSVELNIPSVFKKLPRHFFKGLYQTDEYKKLAQRKFREHINYESFEWFVLSVVMELYCVFTHAKRQLNDAPTAQCTNVRWRFYNNLTFPVYAITPELLKDFLNSDSPNRVWGFKKPFEQALIMLPKDTIISPDGLTVGWIMVDLINIPDSLDDVYEDYLRERTQLRIKSYLLEGKKGNLFLRWVTQPGYLYSYTGTQHFPNHESDETFGAEFNSYLPGSDINKEKAFSSKIASITIQFLLYLLENKVDYLTDEIENKINLHKVRENKEVFNNFILIGNESKIKNPSQGGTHASPKEHYRRGHYRNLPWRDADNQKIWVRPALIKNPKDD